MPVKIVSQLSVFWKKMSAPIKFFSGIYGVHGVSQKLPNQPPEKLWRYFFPPNAATLMVEIIVAQRWGGSGFIQELERSFDPVQGDKKEENEPRLMKKARKQPCETIFSLIFLLAYEGVMDGASSLIIFAAARVSLARGS